MDTWEECYAEVGRLQKWVNDLLLGCYVNCVYCGHRYGPNPGTPVAMAEVLTKHIEVCPKHPLSVVRAALEDALQHHHGTCTECSADGPCEWASKHYALLGYGR